MHDHRRANDRFTSGGVDLPPHRRDPATGYLILGLLGVVIAVLGIVAQRPIPTDTARLAEELRRTNAYNATQTGHLVAAVVTSLAPTATPTRKPTVTPYPTRTISAFEATAAALPTRTPTPVWTPAPTPPTCATSVPAGTLCYLPTQGPTPMPGCPTAEAALATMRAEGASIYPTHRLCVAVGPNDHHP